MIKDIDKITCAQCGEITRIELFAEDHNGLIFFMNPICECGREKIPFSPQHFERAYEFLKKECQSKIKPKEPHGKLLDQNVWDSIRGTAVKIFP